MNSVQSIRVVSLSLLFVFSLLGAGACSGDDSPTSSGNPNLAPAKHKVVYELTGEREGAQIDIDWVDTNGREISEVARIPTTRQATREDGDIVGFRVTYKHPGGSFVLLRAKLFVDDKEWASGTDAGNFLEIELGGTL